MKLDVINNAFALGIYKKLTNRVDVLDESINSIIEIDRTPVVGPIGPQGPQGVVGFTGSAGAQGIQGAVGYTGSVGIQGTTGFTGSQGLTGYTGSVGPQGENGATGFTGSAGIRGEKGITGFTGSQGVVGYTGSVGIQGTTGFTGSQGPAGFTGSQGAIGFTGSVGPQGERGPEGKAGPVGPKGDVGPLGPTGPKGDPGVSVNKDELKEYIVDVVNKAQQELTQLQEELTAQVDSNTEAYLKQFAEKLRNEVSDTIEQHKKLINTKLGSGWGSSSSGGGSVNILQMDDVEFQKRHLVADDSILIFNVNKQKFVSETFIDIIERIKADLEVQYDRLVDSDGDYTYIGEAIPGSLKSAAAWRIKRVAEDGDDIEIIWANNSANFDKTWDDRATYEYS